MAEPEPTSQTRPDPFDSLLSLEDAYYTEGYDLGVADGSRAGRIEGRVFGLEKGFEKFAEMGRLRGRAGVWVARAEEGKGKMDLLPPLEASSSRLGKHVHRLRTLTDPETLSTENSEEGVSEFDDRMKDAAAKVRLIEKMVGEQTPPDSLDDSGDTVAGSSSGGLKVSKGEAASGSKPPPKRPTGEMEDFAGLPFASASSSTAKTD